MEVRHHRTMKLSTAMAMALALVLPGIPGTTCALDRTPPPADCADVEACMALLRDIASAPGQPPFDTDPREASLPPRFARLGDAAVEPLVALLDDPNDNAVRLAISVLREMPHID